MTELVLTPEAMIVPCLVWLFCGDNAVIALLLAAAVHEYGHIASILIFGGTVQRLQIGFSGAEIEYDGLNGRTALFFAAISGSLAGLFFAGALCILKVGFGTIMHLAALLSLFLSLFNLLPASLLDGGQALNALFFADGSDRSKRASKVINDVTVTVLWAVSGFLLLKYSSPLLLPGTISLTICCCNIREKGVKYRQ